MKTLEILAGEGRKRDGNPARLPVEPKGAREWTHVQVGWQRRDFGLDN